MSNSLDERSFDCFLSHNRADKPWVIRLKNELQKHGLKVWLDQDEIRPGDRFIKALEHGIEDCKSVVVVVSPESMQSGWVADEYARALALEKSAKAPVQIIPVILRDAELPGFLANRNWVDFRDKKSFRQSVNQLLFGITGKKRGSPASDKLHDARERVKQLMKNGANQAEVDAAKVEVLEARREVREGGKLQSSDVLLDRYELLDCVGSGGFATVWRCFDEEATRIVAAKILHPSHREEQSKIDRFFRGARAMKQLSHENIVRVLDERCSDEGFHFYIMDFVDGDDFQEAILSRRIAREGVLDIILAAADALHYAHTTLPDLVHRDVKPSNILLASNGQVRVTDFDLVRTADTTGGTRTGSLGTFIYTAPESLQKAGEVDAKADVFSLGMTAVFGLHGQELPVAAFRRTAEFIDSLDCGEGIKQALKQAVEWEPSDRFDSMQDFARGIQEALVQQPTASRKAVPRRRKSKKSKSAAPGSKAKKKATTRRTPEAVDLGDVVTKSIDMQLRLIPAGDFMMGSPDSDASAHGDEKPQHQVRITKPFYLGVYAVTQEQYEKVMGARPWQGRDYAQEGPDNPATYVSHNKAVDFCRKLSDQEGVEYRLPTEAQWEYACRAEGTSIYSFGDDVTPLDQYAWYAKNAWDIGEQYAHAVGQKQPNPWGLYDMHGNVWEWCRDWYGAYENAEVDNPGGPPTGDGRVLRGGSFNDATVNCRSAIRYYGRPDLHNYDIGFRVSRTYN